MKRVPKKYILLCSKYKNYYNMQERKKITVKTTYGIPGILQLKITENPMVLILDSISEIGAHVRSNIEKTCVAGYPAFFEFGYSSEYTF